MIEKDDLPESWELETIGSVSSEIRTGGTPKKSAERYWGGNIPWKASKHFYRNKLDLNTTSQYITEAGRSETTIADEGEVLLVCRGAHTGKVGIAKQFLAFNQDVKVIRLGDTVLSKYVGYYLMSRFKYFKNMQRGGTTKGITTAHIKSLDIPVPPFNKQEQIVETVEERLGRVERLEKSVENVGRLAEEYRDSLTEYLFIGRESLSTPSPDQIPAEDDIPDHWSIKNIGEVSSQIRTGGTPKKSRDDYWGGDIPWKASKHFNGNSLRLNESSEYVTSRGKSESTIANPDDVVIVCRGAHTGKVGLVQSKFLFNQDVKVIRLPEDINSEFVARYLSNHMEYFLQKQRGGTTKGIITNHVKNLKIPIPPIGEQEDIIDELKLIEFGRVFKSVSDVHTHFGEYRDSVLAYAFTGQLNY